MAASAVGRDLTGLTHRSDHGSNYMSLVFTDRVVELATLEWVWWWNNQRLHGELNYRTPIEIENQHYADLETPELATSHGKQWEQNPERITSVVPVTKKDRSVQIVTVSDSAASPSQLQYSLGMPDGTVMQPLPDGSFAMISGEGKLVGTVAAPWAFDANGAAVPTRYEWDGKTLTQVIDLDTAGVAFPVVADPSITWWWWGYAVKYTKAETKAIFNANSDAQAAALACGVLGAVPEAAAACALVAYIVVTVYFNVWKSAVEHNHCIQVNYSFAPPPYPILIYEVKCDR